MLPPINECWAFFPRLTFALLWKSNLSKYPKMDDSSTKICLVNRKQFNETKEMNDGKQKQSKVIETFECAFVWLSIFYIRSTPNRSSLTISMRIHFCFLLAWVALIGFELLSHLLPVPTFACQWILVDNDVLIDRSSSVRPLITVRVRACVFKTTVLKPIKLNKWMWLP